MAIIKKWAIGALFLMMLHGCATLQRATPSDEAEQIDYEYLLNPDSQWTMQGKISYRDERQAAIVNIRWRQLSANHTSIRVFNSIGGDIVRINQQSGETKLRMRGKDIVNPEDIATLVNDEIGYYVPLEQLTFWIKGQAWPDSEYMAVYDATNSMVLHLQQDGWQIDYRKFEKNVARHITAIRQPYVITLVIPSWIKGA